MAGDIPWLGEGNFWKVSWMRTEYEIDWEGLEGSSYEGGTYTMRLGQEMVVSGITFYPIELSGQIDGITPIWQWVGADYVGNVYGKIAQTDAPTIIYSTNSNAWVGSGFYTDFAGYSPIYVGRNSAIIPSQITRRAAFFNPPLTSVGYSHYDSGYSSGSGCEYFGAYGTICTGPSSGPSRGKRIFEYWDADAGPVAMHYAYDYEDCVGVYCNETHIEDRLEVWFFGDADSQLFDMEKEPDSYDDPSHLPIAPGELYTVYGEINPLDESPGSFADDWLVFGHPEGENPDYTEAQAAEIQDWYSFEITDSTLDQDMLFYLLWGQSVDLEFSLFMVKEASQPEFTGNLLIYLADGGPCEGDLCDEFDHSEMFGSSFSQTGTYLLGVRHPEPAPNTTQYGIFNYVSSGISTTDTDGDGVNDATDAFPLDASEDTDTDEDGIGNNADLDDDGDGFPDSVENDLDSNALDADSFPPADEITFEAMSGHQGYLAEPTNTDLLQAGVCDEATAFADWRDIGYGEGRTFAAGKLRTDNLDASPDPDYAIDGGFAWEYPEANTVVFITADAPKPEGWAGLPLLLERCQTFNIGSYYSAQAYSDINVDVRDAIDQGLVPSFQSVTDHYVKYGFKEGRLTSNEWSEAQVNAWNDPGYLSANPDVANYFQGAANSGWSLFGKYGFAHWINFGQYEGRGDGQ
jgi:hypothetical protein